MKAEGKRRIIVDKDALVQRGHELAAAIVKICDTVAVTDELDGHYRATARLCPPIRRALSALKRHRGKLVQFPDSGLDELPRKFRKAFANPGDEYLIKAVRDSGASVLITCDGAVQKSPSQGACSELYKKLGLRVLAPDGYPPP